MRPICWLHISDIHMRASDAWSQDVVLKAMCDDISRRRKAGTAVDFILVTGDLAFSGKSEEYALSALFFDAISSAAGIGKEQIFCIPGNHDIQRERQKLCFLGARSELQNPNRVDLTLSPEEDMATLLKRQENYRNFQRSYFVRQSRTETADGLAFVTRLEIDDIVIAIMGLDSAWLAEGGLSDHGKLLIGERQVINALALAEPLDPHVVIAMAHHPFHLLQEFDRRPVQSRIERGCHFFHCGHLHSPESRAVGVNSSGCLTLAAGASFETRQSNNAYSVVTLDLLRGERTVKIVQYHPASGTFSFESTELYDIEATPVCSCGVAELATAMKNFQAALSPIVHYLAALLLDQKSEVPIPDPQGHTFGSFAVLQAQPESELRALTVQFMVFKNALRVLHKRVPLTDIFAQHGESVVKYGAALEMLCKNPAIRARLEECEKDGQMLANALNQDSSGHTGALFSELLTAQDWPLLRVHAERHAESPNQALAVQAKRMLAMCLAQSGEPADRGTAIELYRVLVQSHSASGSDFGNLATLLIENDNFDDAKAMVIAGIEQFPSNAEHLSQIGQRIVESTGDRNLRERLAALKKQRGQRG